MNEPLRNLVGPRGRTATETDPLEFLPRGCQVLIRRKGIPAQLLSRVLHAAEALSWESCPLPVDVESKTKNMMSSGQEESLFSPTHQPPPPCYFFLSALQNYLHMQIFCSPSNLMPQRIWLDDT